MGSSYFGIPKLGNNSHEKSSSSSSSSSSKKNKKGSTDKPKQPQRGLGVAQLEQIRLRTQLGCSGFSSSTPTTSFVQDDVRLQGMPTYNPYYSQSSPSTSSPYADHPNFMMVFGDHERPNLRYQDSQSSTASRWNPNGVLESSASAQPGAGSRHLTSYYEESRHQRIDFLKSMGSSSHNSESNDHEEVDLELRL